MGNYPPAISFLLKLANLKERKIKIVTARVYAPDFG